MLEIIALLDVLKDALNTIYDIATGQHEDAKKALKSIQKVYKTVQNVTARRITVEEAQQALIDLRKGLRVNDDVADAAVDDKFG